MLGGLEKSLWPNMGSRGAFGPKVFLTNSSSGLRAGFSSSSFFFFFGFSFSFFSSTFFLGSCGGFFSASFFFFSRRAFPASISSGVSVPSFPFFTSSFAAPGLNLPALTAFWRTCTCWGVALPG